MDPDLSRIVMAIRGKRNLADAAEELSLYIYPGLANELKLTTVNQALFWIPYMKKHRIDDAVQHIGCKSYTLLAELTDVQRRGLADYLDNIREYQKLNKGKSHA